MPKITDVCKKKLKKIEKTKPLVTKQIRHKLSNFHFEGSGKTASIGASGSCRAYKLYLTTPYGSFRLIVIDNALIDIVLIEVYAKNSKLDLTKDEYQMVKEILTESNNPNFWKSLSNL